MCEKVLQHLFEDTYYLYLKTLNYHWNVTAPNFMELHLLFRTQYEELLEGTDTVAEYIRSLKLSIKIDVPKPCKDMNPINFSLSSTEMIKDLKESHEQITRYIKQEAPKISDISVTDLMIERTRYHEKAAWMLRSYI